MDTKCSCVHLVNMSQISIQYINKKIINKKLYFILLDSVEASLCLHIHNTPLSQYLRTLLLRVQVTESYILFIFKAK